MEMRIVQIIYSLYLLVLVPIKTHVPAKVAIVTTTELVITKIANPITPTSLLPPGLLVMTAILTLTTMLSNPTAVLAKAHQQVVAVLVGGNQSCRWHLAEYGNSSNLWPHSPSHNYRPRCRGTCTSNWWSPPFLVSILELQSQQRGGSTRVVEQGVTVPAHCGHMHLR